MTMHGHCRIKVTGNNNSAETITGPATSSSCHSTCSENCFINQHVEFIQNLLPVSLHTGGPMEVNGRR